MALHEQCVGATDEWYTPPHVFEALDCAFDLDVAAPSGGYNAVPARKFLCSRALEQSWEGFVWMNPPFGGRNALSPWLERFFAHGDGIALVPDRTSAPWFQRYAPQADLLLFVSPKLQFIGEDGRAGKSPAQGTCLMALGERGIRALRRAAMKGLGFVALPEVAR